MPPELTQWLGQYGTGGLLIGLALMMMFGRGPVPRFLYDEVKIEQKADRATTQALLHQMEDLARAVESVAASQREILIWVQTTLTPLPPGRVGRRDE